MSRSTRCALGCLLPIILVGVPLNLLTAEGPISQEELLALVTTTRIGAVTPQRVVELIRERGIGFRVKDILLQELKAREADPAIIRAVEEHRQTGPPASVLRPPPGVEPPPPVFIPPPVEPSATEPAAPGSAPTPKPAATPPATAATEPATTPGRSGLPDRETWPQFLEQVRSTAMAYTENLPNFICTQITQRYLRRLPKTGWVRVDNFVAELTYYDKQEHYKLVSVGNRSAASDATLESLKGTTSTGEFGSSLNYLFDPATGTQFRFEGIDHSRGSPTVRVGFRVPKDTSKRSIIFREGTTEVGVVTPYRGRCWIDPGSLQVVQIKERAYRIPETFPITRSEGSTQYDRVEIAEQQHWLPVRAEVLLENRSARLHTRNVIQFKQYRRFGSEVKFVTE
ncbi:MAG: hypothetical protein OXI69_17440 [Acidobacteriota bacterium]|nr:hypothetical protein [Acidobacteriota bacterium]